MEHHVAALERAFTFIEARLAQPLAIEEIARHAGFSTWHFQRLFSAVVGEPVASWLRRRRLTAAALALRGTRTRILEVALAHQFESHEAFTRAFRTAFGVTPSAFRRGAPLPWPRARPRLDPRRLAALARLTAMTPDILHLPACTLAGLSARFIGALSPDANNFRVIPPLWAEFLRRQSEWPAAADAYTYGACRCLPAGERQRDDELLYLASVRLAPGATPPPDFTGWAVPACTYARFLHRGPTARLPETLNYAYGVWLPRSGYAGTDDAPELERYDGRFRGGDAEDSVFEVLIPLAPTPAAPA